MIENKILSCNCDSKQRERKHKNIEVKKMTFDLRVVWQSPGSKIHATKRVQKLLKHTHTYAQK